MEMTYSRHCLTPFSGFVIRLKCSINFGKRLKRNQRPDLSFSLKGPNLVSHLSSTFPKPDLPQNWLCVSQWGTTLFSPRSNKGLSLALQFHHSKYTFSVAFSQVKWCFGVGQLGRGILMTEKQKANFSSFIFILTNSGLVKAKQEALQRYSPSKDLDGSLLGPVVPGPWNSTSTNTQ